MRNLLLRLRPLFPLSPFKSFITVFHNITRATIFRSVRTVRYTDLAAALGAEFYFLATGSTNFVHKRRRKNARIFFQMTAICKRNETFPLLSVFKKLGSS